MTVSVQDARVVYQGSGSTGPFSVAKGGNPIIFKSNSHIKVRKLDDEGNETLLVESTHYTLTGGPINGQVTLVAALASDELIAIYREQPIEQTVDLQTADPFNSANVVLQYDKIFLILQELKDDVDRSIKVSRTSEIGAEVTELPELTFTFTQDGEGAVSRTAQDKLREIFSVKDFGTLGDNTDATEAFQAAAAAFGSETAGPFGEYNGGILFVPKGVYQISEQILFAVPGVRIVGEGIEATKIYVNTNLGANGVFKFDQTNASYSAVGVAVENLSIHMEGFTGHAVWMRKPYDGSGARNVLITNVADAYQAFRIEEDPDNVSDSVSQTLVFENVWGYHLNDTATAPLFYAQFVQEITCLQSKMAGDIGVDTSPCHPWHFEDCRAVTMYGCSTSQADNHGVLISATTRDVDLVLVDGMTYETIAGCIKTEVTGAFRVKHLVNRAPRYEGSVTNVAGEYDLNGCLEAIVESRGKTVNLDANSSALSILGDSSGTVTNAGSITGWQRYSRLALGGLANPDAALSLATGSTISWGGATTTLEHSANLLVLNGAAFVFNESGADLDVRFEGDTDANLLFLDASVDRLGIGTNAPASGKLHVTHGASELIPAGRFVNTTDNGTVIGLRIEGDRATPTNLDGVAEAFYLSNAAGTQIEYARTTALATTVTAGAENGQFRWAVMDAGVLTSKLLLSPTNLLPVISGLIFGSATNTWGNVFLSSAAKIDFGAGNGTLTHSLNLLTADGLALVWNEAGADLDMRFEGDTDVNLFFLDASTDRIGFGINTPATKFHVSVASTVAARFENTNASGAAAGSFVSAISNDGAAIASGDRLGGFVAGGASDASSTIGLQAGMVGWAAEAWSGAAAGAYLTLETTSIGGTTRTERVRIDSDGQFIGKPASTTPASLAANGNYTLTPTSNTNFRISYRGSDGVTRVGNITLA
jgi:hypothetical protein